MASSAINLNFPIIELAYIHQIQYADGGGHHYVVSYLLDVNGNETVCEVLPTTTEQLRQLPMVEEHNQVTVMSESGQVIDQFVLK